MKFIKELLVAGSILANQLITPSVDAQGINCLWKIVSDNRQWLTPQTEPVRCNYSVGVCTTYIDLNARRTNVKTGKQEYLYRVVKTEESCVPASRTRQAESPFNPQEHLVFEINNEGITINGDSYWDSICYTQYPVYFLESFRTN
jgi:hypothetical protein